MGMSNAGCRQVLFVHKVRTAIALALVLEAAMDSTTDSGRQVRGANDGITASSFELAFSVPRGRTAADGKQGSFSARCCTSEDVYPTRQ